MSKPRIWMSGLLLAIGIAIATPGCVSKDPETGRIAPPGTQKYDYELVRERARDLRKGMSKLQVLLLLGSPAQQGQLEWVYLPNRSGLIVPAESLKITFDSGLVSDYRFSPIILGQDL